MYGLGHDRVDDGVLEGRILKLFAEYVKLREQDVLLVEHVGRLRRFFLRDLAANLASLRTRQLTLSSIDAAHLRKGNARTCGRGGLRPQAEASHRSRPAILS